MAGYDTILFDADNTLFDFDRAEGEALRQVLTGRGYAADEKTLACYGEINRALWQRFDRGEITRDFLGPERFRQFMARMGGNHDPEEFNRDYLAVLAGSSQLLPGAEEMCRRLAARCRLVIVTNGMTAAQSGRVENSAIRDCISGLFISQSMGCQKPQREFFLQVYRALGLTEDGLRRTVMVGDSLATDILGGIQGGIDTVWYNPRRLPGDPRIRPTREVWDFSAMERVLLGEDD